MPMLLVDAVHVIEMVGGVLMWMSAIAFILLGVMVGIRRKSGDKLSSARTRQLNLVAKMEKKPISKAPASKVA
jgi:hypothetical protein